ncbi:hypothetical protein Nepgr_006387 [Nepenthes gracilis]|uniref:MIP18 family-like domain-containing protein n=1 Tax=Nepenthes gracilis TaxID=150966 RepID=A0AAD3S5I9_NEPGR|nr:hypothetical protein Nepgr_006387 [Nepenthes gracilis]
MIYELLDEWLNRPSTGPNVSSVSDGSCWSSSVEASVSAISMGAAENDVLKAHSQFIDPDFTDIVPCGFVKDMPIDLAPGEVIFHLELTTPACPIKDMFEQRTKEVVSMLPWVNSVKVTMSAQPVRPVFACALLRCLQTISNIVAIFSRKGDVEKSTDAVNLAYLLAGMGIGVRIFDANAYGPSLLPIVSPKHRLLEMNPEKMTILPTEYFDVKLVTFGLSGQGRAVMRGPMVSEVINQLLTTAEWRELDYLVIDMLPRTNDIQLTLCQIIPLTVAVIVTTPQKLAFIDVAKGVHMFSKLKVPCVVVVQNMCHFEADGKPLLIFTRVFPFFNLEDKVLAMERVMLHVRWIQFIKHPQGN